MRKRPQRKAVLKSLKAESDRALIDMIRRWQALPPEMRTHFLRKRVRPGASAA